MASTLPPLSERLRPAGAATGTAELLACLTLVAPSGMTREERGQWLVVARRSITGIPADLLARGCSAARLKADHPSKIVPAIFAEVGEAWEKRKAEARRERTADQRRLEEPDYVSPEEAARILREHGLKPSLEQ